MPLNVTIQPRSEGIAVQELPTLERRELERGLRAVRDRLAATGRRDAKVRLAIDGTADHTEVWATLACRGRHVTSNAREVSMHLALRHALQDLERSVDRGALEPERVAPGRDPASGWPGPWAWVVAIAFALAVGVAIGVSVTQGVEGIPSPQALPGFDAGAPGQP